MDQRSRKTLLSSLLSLFVLIVNRRKAGLKSIKCTFQNRTTGQLRMPQNNFLFLPLQQCFPQICFPCERVKPAHTGVLCFSPAQMPWSFAGASGTLQSWPAKKGPVGFLQILCVFVLVVWEPVLRQFELQFHRGNQKIAESLTFWVFLSRW